MCIWYRILAAIKIILFGGAPLDDPTASSSPANRLPQEVVDMIVAHLIHDTRSLLACSSTSRSWYGAAAPHLHRTLIIQNNAYANKKAKWPEPLRAASKFGFLPFVTRVSISRGIAYGYRFSSMDFNHRSQREFSALINVRELSIERLDIPSFIPKIREYFGQFSTTLRSLTLIDVIGSGGQFVFYVGLFPHLEDLEFEGCSSGYEEDDLTLIPSSVPSFRGRLTAHFPGDAIGKAMLRLFGEIRFRRMDLRRGGIQHLLYACPNTMETLKLDATDICGEKYLPKGIQALIGDFKGKSCRDLDLRRKKSLRKLEITASSLIWVLKNRAPATVPSSFRALLSTVESPVFSDVVVVYRHGDFYNDVYSNDAPTELGDEETWYHRQFEVFRAMFEAQDYRLVLSMNWVGDDSVREIKRAVVAERAKGGLPLQIAMPYSLRTH